MPLYFVSFRAIFSPALVFFSSCLGSGIGRLALRYPPSACGRLFATFRPLSLCHVSRGHKRQRPARNVLNAGVAPAACEGLLPAVLFLFCLLVGDVIPAFVLFPQFYSGFVCCHRMLFDIFHQKNPFYLHISEKSITFAPKIYAGGLCLFV